MYREAVDAEHDYWLRQRGLATPRLAPISETLYSGLIAAAMLGTSSVCSVVLAALLPERSDLFNAKLEYIKVPSRGIDMILSFRLAADSCEAGAIILLEHKRFGPANFPKHKTYKRRARHYERCVHTGEAQRRRSGDPGTPGIAQLDAAVCFDDWRDEVTEGATVLARVFLDAQGRSPNSTFHGKLTHPGAWIAASYGGFGGALRQAYDQAQKDIALRQGLLPLVRGLHAY